MINYVLLRILWMKKQKRNGSSRSSILSRNISLQSMTSDDICYTCFMCPSYVKKYRSCIRHMDKRTR